MKTIAASLLILGLAAGTAHAQHSHHHHGHHAHHHHGHHFHHHHHVYRPHYQAPIYSHGHYYAPVYSYGHAPTIIIKPAEIVKRVIVKPAPFAVGQSAPIAQPVEGQPAPQVGEAAPVEPTPGPSADLQIPAPAPQQ